MSPVSPYASRLARPVSVAAAAAILMSGCGLVRAPATPLPAGQAIRLAAHAGSQVRSITATETVAFAIPRLPHLPAGILPPSGLRLTMHMQLQFRPQLLGEVSMDAFGKSMTEVITSRAVYVRLPGFAARVGRPWVKISISTLRRRAGLARLFAKMRGQAGLVSNPLDDATLFKAATHLRTLGSWAVDGVPATAYSGVLPFTALRSFAPGAARLMFAKMPRFLRASAIPFTVWVDGQHHVRKLVMRMTLRVRGHKFSMTVTLNVTSVNQPVHVKPPPASQVSVLRRF